METAMMTKRVCFTRAAVLVAAGLFATAAPAQIELYEKDDTKLDLNVNVVGAVFTGSDSWFGESTTFLGADTDHWAELGLEPGLSFETGVGGGTLFAALSGVYTNTFDDDASGLAVGLADADDVTLEQAHLGWKVEDLFSGLEEDSFSITGGRQDYSIGTGLIVNDGGGDGGERGGWYIGMRKAFKNAVIASLKSKRYLVEAFRLENDPRAGGTSGNAVGGNFEYSFPDQGTFGGSYLLVDANLPMTPDLDVYSARGSWKFFEALGVGGEFVHETSSQIEADGWYGQVSWDARNMAWTPTFSYRYAHFDGDDPATADDESFREIAYGFTDYGTWYQGEIAGNYPLANGNLNSHLLRAKAQPREDVTLNVLLYNFTLDEPATLDPGVTDDHFGDEIDLAIDWEATKKLYVIGVVGVLLPGDAAEQWVGGNDDWTYAMVYGSYTF
jgi:hypothetical protein